MWSEQPNNIYKEFSRLKNDMEIVDHDKHDKKLLGAIAVEVFKKNIERVFSKNNLYYKVSQNNVYVNGYPIEFDLLILKDSAKNLTLAGYELPIYDTNDVVAILECKTNGIYQSYYREKTESIDIEALKKNSLYKFVEAYKDICKFNPKLKLGYMTISEKSVKNGKSNFVKNTNAFFADYFKYNYLSQENWNAYYSRCYFDSNNIRYCYALDKDWEDFVISLVK